MMTDPTKFTPGYSYTGYQAANPAEPLPASQVDNDMSNIATSISQSVDAIKDVRRSDGALKNAIVTPDSLSATTRALLTEGEVDPDSLYEPSLTGANYISVRSSLERWADPRAFCAMDGETDDAANLNSWLTALKNEGIGEARLPAGTFAIGATTVDVPTDITFMGAGSNSRNNSGTMFLCLSASSQIKFGGQGTDNASFGGPIGRFTILGQDLATQPLYFGRLLQRDISDIVVRDGGDGIAILIEEAQNSHFHSVNVEGAAGKGMVIDRGAGGLLFSRMEINETGEEALLLQETSGGTGVYERNTHITFNHCLLERSPSGRSVVQTAGYDIVFNSPVFANTSSAHTLEVPLVDIVNGSRVKFRDATFFGSTGYSTGLKLGDGVSAELHGTPRFIGLKHGIELVTGCFFDYERVDQTSITDTFFTGTGGADTYARKRLRAPTEIRRDNATDLALLVQLEADNGPRARFSANGTLAWGDGGGTTDVSVYRSASGRLTTQGQMATTNGFIVPLLSAAPTAVEGMLVRADGVGWDPGGVGAEHVVMRVGGAWKRLDA